MTAETISIDTHFDDFLKRLVRLDERGDYAQRELTPAERRVDFAAIKKILDDDSLELVKSLRGILKEARDSAMRLIEQQDAMGLTADFAQSFRINTGREFSKLVEDYLTDVWRRNRDLALAELPDEVRAKLRGIQRYHLPGEHEQDSHGNWAEGNDSSGAGSAPKLDLSAVNVPWEHRFPPIADDPAPGGKYEYHAKRADKLPEIAREGIKGSRSRPISVAPHLESARFWGDAIDAGQGNVYLMRLDRQAMRQLNIRIEKPERVLGEEVVPDTDGTREHWVEASIPPSVIEIYFRGKWRPLEAAVTKKFHLPGEHDQDRHGDWAEGGGEGGKSQKQGSQKKLIGTARLAIKLKDGTVVKAETASSDESHLELIQRAFMVTHPTADLDNNDDDRDLFDKFSESFYADQKFGVLGFLTPSGRFLSREEMDEMAAARWGGYQNKLEVFASSFKPDVAGNYWRNRALLIKGIVDDELTTATKYEIFEHLKGGRTLTETMRNLRELFEPFVGDPAAVEPSGISGTPEDILRPYRLENIVRTETATAVNQGRKMVADAADDFVLGYELSATLDERTTEVCQLADGLKFRKDDPLAVKLTPALHFQCRTLVVFITVNDVPVDWSSEEELDEVVREIPRGFK